MAGAGGHRLEGYRLCGKKVWQCTRCTGVKSQSCCEGRIGGFCGRAADPVCFRVMSIEIEHANSAVDKIRPESLSTCVRDWTNFEDHAICLRWSSTRKIMSTGVLFNSLIVSWIRLSDSGSSEACGQHCPGPVDGLDRRPNSPGYA